MKKLLLVLWILVSGCQQQSQIEKIEEILYQQETVYVEQSEDKVMQEMNLSKSDFTEMIALETLLIYERQEILVFENASERLNQLLTNKGKSIKIQEYTIYMSQWQEDVIAMIENELN